MFSLLKKFGYIILSMSLMAHWLQAKEWDLGDRSLVEDFGMGIVGQKLDIYDPDALSEWVLKTYYRKKYNRTHDDEFEFDSAKQWALEAFKKRISMLRLPSKNDHFNLYLNARFGKYDFKHQRFPVKALTEDSYLTYGGEGKIVSYYQGSKLTFENVDSEKNFIYMKKDQAKRFISKRKSSGGWVDRKLIIHYVYTLQNAKENREFDPGNSEMTIDFTGKIKYMEIMDSSRKTIIQRIDFNDEQKKSEEGKE